MPNIEPEPAPAPALVHVMVAVIHNHREEVLVALRHPQSHQGGLWEFPGGKRESGEPALQALHREILEETGLRLLASHPLCRIEHRYVDKHVLLDVHLVNRHVGEPAGREGQQIAWRPRRDLRRSDFPAANAGIVEILRLPGAITITPTVAGEREFLDLMQSLICSGRELIQVRQPRLPPNRYLEWFVSALELAAGTDTRLLFNNPPENYDPNWRGSGYHASSQTLAALETRPVSPDQLFSASCHSLAELHRAQSLGANFALLSPVRETGKYAASELLGWGGFRQLADRVSLPVYALGGMQPDHLSLARSHGAFGIAGISGFV